MLNNLFKHPYSKIEFVVRDFGVSRITAANYLNQLSKNEILKKENMVNNGRARTSLFHMQKD